MKRNPRRWFRVHCLLALLGGGLVLSCKDTSQTSPLAVSDRDYRIAATLSVVLRQHRGDSDIVTTLSSPSALISIGEARRNGLFGAHPSDVPFMSTPSLAAATRGKRGAKASSAFRISRHGKVRTVRRIATAAGSLEIQEIESDDDVQGVPVSTLLLRVGNRSAVSLHPSYTKENGRWVLTGLRYNRLDSLNVSVATVTMSATQLHQASARRTLLEAASDAVSSAKQLFATRELYAKQARNRDCTSEDLEWSALAGEFAYQTMITLGLDALCVVAASPECVEALLADAQLAWLGARLAIALNDYMDCLYSAPAQQIGGVTITANLKCHNEYWNEWYDDVTYEEGGYWKDWVVEVCVEAM